MSRFSEPQDPAFQALNASIGFDRRLWPFDVAQSRAHARMLAARGIIEAGDRDALLAGLDEVERELAEERFPFAPDDEDIHMAIERRLTEVAGPVGGRLHTARSRNDQVATDVSLFTREAAGVAVTRVDALVRALLGAAERHLDWAMPGYTHLQRAQPVYLVPPPARLRLDAPARPRALPGRDRRSERDAAGCGRAGGRELRHGPSDACRTTSASPPWHPTRSTRWPTATSSWTTCTPPPRPRRTSRGWAPSWCCGPARSSGSSCCPTRGRAARRSCPRRRTPTPPSCCGPRRRGSSGTSPRCTASCTRCRSPTTRTCRRTRSTSSTRSTRCELSLAAAAGMVGGARFDRERLAAAAADELIAATDLADLLVKRGTPVPRGPRRRRRARARGGGERAPARRARGRRRSAPAPTRSSRAGVVAGVEGQRGRHGAGPRPRAAGGRPCGARWLSRPSAWRRPSTTARSLDGRARPRGLPRRARGRGRDRRRDGGLPLHRAGLPRVRRPDRRAPRRSSARPASPTSTAPTGSTRCSTRSASPRASAPPC